VSVSPPVNYIDRATAAAGELSSNLRVEGVTWSAKRISTVVYLCFLDRSRYYLFQVVLLSSRGRVNSVPDPLLLREPGTAGNRTVNLWICNQEL
jgi:hypothetical protein